MIVKHAVNGGEAEVSDEEGKALIESGGWVPADAPTKRTPRKRAPVKVE